MRDLVTGELAAYVAKATAIASGPDGTAVSERSIVGSGMIDAADDGTDEDRLVELAVERHQAERAHRF